MKLIDMHREVYYVKCDLGNSALHHERFNNIRKIFYG